MHSTFKLVAHSHSLYHLLQAHILPVTIPVRSIYHIDQLKPLAPGLALTRSKMPSDGSSLAAVISAQEPIVQDLLRQDIEHGVLIPLKTNLELRDDYATGNILITRVPTKLVANTIEYARPAHAAF